MTIKELYEKYGDVELTEEQEKHIKEYLKIENKKWKPKEGENYYYVDNYGDIEREFFSESDRLDYFNFFSNNYFKTEEEAEFRLEQIKVYNELKNFADENNEEIDWKDAEQDKWFIKGINLRNNKLIFDYNFELKFLGQIYFSSEKLAEQAIEKVGADRIKKYLFGVE